MGEGRELKGRVDGIQRKENLMNIQMGIQMRNSVKYMGNDKQYETDRVKRLT